MAHDALRDHCLELLAAVGHPQARRMFGGQGFYVDGLFIALIASDRLYLKTSDETRGRFEAAGCQPFAFAKKDGETVVTSYWSAPEEAMDSPQAMAPWARLALGAALGARQAEAARLRKRKAPAPGSRPAASGAARPTASARPKR